MNLTLFRRLVLKVIDCPMKYARSVYTLSCYNNILTSNELINAHSNPYYLPCFLNKVNKFSTTNILLKVKKKTSKEVPVDHNALSEYIKLDKMTSAFAGEVEKFKEQLIKHAAARSQVGSIEELPISFESEKHKLQELVEISRKPKLIVLDASAFPQIIPTILEELAKSQMNLNPQRDGTTIYVPIPKITKEYRENLLKNAKHYFNQCKRNIMDIRNSNVKILKKAKGAPIDLVYKGEEYITVLHREYINKAEELLKLKEKELLGTS